MVGRIDVRAGVSDGPDFLDGPSEPVRASTRRSYWLPRSFRSLGSRGGADPGIRTVAIMVAMAGGAREADALLGKIHGSRMLAMTGPASLDIGQQDLSIAVD